MKETMKDRLVQYLEYKGLSHYKFQKLAGLSNGYVHNLKDSINSSALIRIQSTFPDLNTTWLIGGEGNMILDSKTQSSVDNSQNVGNIVENSNTGNITQISNTNEPLADKNDSNKLYQQIVDLKDSIAKMKSRIFKASKCPTLDECVKMLDEIMSED